MTVHAQLQYSPILHCELLIRACFQLIDIFFTKIARTTMNSNNVKSHMYHIQTMWLTTKRKKKQNQQSKKPWTRSNKCPAVGRALYNSKASTSGGTPVREPARVHAFYCASFYAARSSTTEPIAGYCLYSRTIWKAVGWWQMEIYHRQNNAGSASKHEAKSKN